jgi:phospholipid transport system substrate-binding protein
MGSVTMRNSPSAWRALAASLLLVAVPLAGSAEAGMSAPTEPEIARASGPVRLISDTVDEVIDVLNDSSLSPAARRVRIEKIAYARFDFDTMSKLVVARYWKRFTPEQRDEFIREFKAFLARTYGARIDQYNQQQVEIVGERPEARGDVTVLTRIRGGEFEGAEVNYRLRQRDGVWRVIDVKVEGISLVLNYRDQFKSLLSRGGPEGLLEKLRKKNAEGAVEQG